MRLLSLPAAMLAGVIFSLPLHAAEIGAASVDAAWVKAMRANDIDAVVSLYAANAIAWFPNAPQAKGTQAIRAGYEGLMGPNTVKDVTLSETGYSTRGNVSVGWGRFTLTLAPKAGGDPIVLVGRFTEVSEKIGGKWKYVVDHASADPAPAAPPAPAK